MFSIQLIDENAKGVFRQECVDPDFIRMGYGNKMMEYISGAFDWQIVKIETAEEGKFVIEK